MRKGEGKNYVFAQALEFNYIGSATYFKVAEVIKLRNQMRNTEHFGASLSKLFSCCLCMCECKQLASMYLCVWMTKTRKIYHHLGEQLQMYFSVV